jgi:hypothetical protein
VKRRDFLKTSIAAPLSCSLVSGKETLGSVEIANEPQALLKTPISMEEVEKQYAEACRVFPDYEEVCQRYRYLLTFDDTINIRLSDNPALELYLSCIRCKHKEHRMSKKEKKRRKQDFILIEKVARLRNECIESARLLEYTGLHLEKRIKAQNNGKTD